MFRLLLFLFGFILMTIGFVFDIIYLNLLTFGYSFLEYLGYIFTHIECLYTLIGLFIILVVFKEKRHVIHK